MRKVWFIITIIIVLSCLTACTPAQGDGDRYSAEFAYGPQQYMLFINKELQAPINQVSDMLSALKKYEKEEFSDDALLSLAKSGYREMEECCQAIHSMRPAKEYTEEAEQLEEVLSKIKETYDDLIALLEDEPINRELVIGVSDELYESYLLITAETGVYWK